MAEPVRHLAESHSIQVVAARPTTRLYPHQVRLAQNAQMFTDRRLADMRQSGHDITRLQGPVVKDSSPDL